MAFTSVFSHPFESFNQQVLTSSNNSKKNCVAYTELHVQFLEADLLICA